MQASAERKDSAATGYKMFQGKILEYDNDGIVCHDTDDRLIWNQSYEMTTPELSVCEQYLAVYDRGGTFIYIMSERGLVKKIETATPIERVCVARQGTVAVLMKEDDVSYVRLYDKRDRNLPAVNFIRKRKFSCRYCAGSGCAETGSRYARRDKGQNLFHGYFL